MKCHFVPQGYLRRFTNEKNLLECCDLHRDYQPTRTQAPKVTAQIEDWYVLRKPQDTPALEYVGEKDIEEAFVSLYEKDLPAALDRLERQSLTSSDKELLARFVAIQLHRAPISREYYRQVKRQDAKQELSREQALQRNAEIAHGFLGTLVSGMTLEPFLMESTWMLVRRRGATPFITSDNPILVQNHPQNQNYLAQVQDWLAARGQSFSDAESKARKGAYCVSVSPQHVLYINTSLPRNPADTSVETGSWDAARVQQYNDLVFRSCLSCVYTVTKELALSYAQRHERGEIQNDLFVDDPFQEAGGGPGTAG
ncbi:DUF4238 domain-containing protein [Vitiosangium sp. GDMCC 1.1324]|uniref:DUF4238 domain-containing protein n=1 Tax=Vitiosangium sp. (strain GDMCC 1.1324) TaxID=2138576 RepID=UPI000D3BB018|nr:DUF4238 domain-containing protein [Vitiosangium sp. GDMCC 1.1324]PTL75444.1 hypothetical protein DAT35_55005 [Vitiosangium sp. GDMCC 1.1324]